MTRRIDRWRYLAARYRRALERSGLTRWERRARRAMLARALAEIAVLKARQAERETILRES